VCVCEREIHLLFFLQICFQFLNSETKLSISLSLQIYLLTLNLQLRDLHTHTHTVSTAALPSHTPELNMTANSNVS